MIGFVLRQKDPLVLRLNRCPALLRHVASAAALVGVVVAAEPGMAKPAEEITGIWLTEDGEGAIEIKPCGAQRCGNIYWMKPPKVPPSAPFLDRNNPDPTLRSRPICGLQIISELKPQTDGSWGDGRVYNPENGKFYGMEIRRRAPDILEVTGYLGITLFGQTMAWRRAPADLPSCAEPPPQKGAPPQKR